MAFEALPLCPGEVHVWITDPDSDEIVDHPARYLAWLSAEERDRHARFVFDKDRRLFLAAHAQVRAALSLYADVPPADWAFRANPYGRPEIASPPPAEPLHFNLSHASGMVASAVARVEGIGIDVERVERNCDEVEIARRFFARSEFEDLSALSGDSRRRRFLEYWTLKESFAKACGQGLSLPLDQFWFRIADAGEIAMEAAPGLGRSGRGWQFESFRPTPKHQAALAVCNHGGQRKRVTVRRFDLLTGAGAAI